MDKPPFEVTVEERIAHLRLCRPESFNAMSFAGIVQLGEAVRALAADARIRCLLLSSTGKHFTSGMQLDEFREGGPALPVATPRDRSRFQTELARLMDAFDALDRAPIPVIAAIQGGCIGGGVDLVAAADVRYCSADAFFAIQEINVGIVADLGTLQRLPKLIPPAVVREYAYSGRRMPAERALQVGLVNDVFATAAETLAAAMQLAREIAAKSPLAIGGIKQAINYARDHSTRESLEHMAVLQSAIFSTTDLHAAVAARKDKREVGFEDR